MLQKRWYVWFIWCLGQNFSIVDFQKDSIQTKLIVLLNLELQFINLWSRYILPCMLT